MAAAKNRHYVQWILLGLPLGLILTSSVFVVTGWLGEDSFGQKAPDTSSAKPPVSSGTEKVEKQLREYVEVLSERIGERHSQRMNSLQAAELFLESTLGPSNLGYRVRRHEYEVDGQTFVNLEVETPGQRAPEEVVVVGAHYDSAPGTPGADDNASGVASLLVLAGNAVRKRPHRTIRWVAFTNEEPPWFQTQNMGSLRYASRLKKNNVKVVAMISLESLGYYRNEPGSQKYPAPLDALYPSTGNFLAVVGNARSKRLVDHVHQVLTDTKTLPVEKGAFPELVPGVGWSDHWSFWQQGYPAVMLTDTAPYRNPHYHQPTDRASTLDFKRMAAAVTAIEVAIDRLAGDVPKSW